MRKRLPHIGFQHSWCKDLSMRYSGIQPQYFPRIHYFARILQSDFFMIRDDCQFVRNHKYPDGKRKPSYQAHTPIKQLEGVRLLAVSVKHRDVFAPISKTDFILNGNWVKDHLNILKANYYKSPHFATLFPEIERILAEKFESLSELNIATVNWGLLHFLDIPFKHINQCSLDYINSVLSKQNIFRLRNIQLASQTKSVKNFTGMSANEKIVALCKEIGVTEDYCGGTAMSAYLDEDIFAKNGILVTVQDWKCTVYPQQFAKQVGFIPNLSLIDLFMNVSREQALDIIIG